MKRWMKITLGVLAVLAAAAAFVLMPPSAKPDGEQSLALFKDKAGRGGMLAVPFETVDPGRPTAPNGSFAGSPERTLKGKVWFPHAQSGAPYPLIVYSHGFMSSIAEVSYLADFLVPKGYVMVAVDYPLTNGQAPGGPNARDVRNQPGDVSYVIDQILVRNDTQGDALHGLIDPERIAVAGLSLGGLTTELVTFHRDWRDPRIKAAVSIAGPSAYFDQAFYQTTEAPYLMIAGSDDAIVPYAYNAAPLPDLDDDAILVTLEHGSHVGFASIAATMFRWADNPDAIACPMLVQNLNREDNTAAPMFEPNADIGIISADPRSVPCLATTWERAMRPAEQQMLTRLAFYAFMESVFNPDRNTRAQMYDYLVNGLATENPGARVTTRTMEMAED